MEAHFLYLAMFAQQVSDTISDGDVSPTNHAVLSSNPTIAQCWNAAAAAGWIRVLDTSRVQV